jgi:protoheme IX farnesyltransferase
LELWLSYEEKTDRLTPIFDSSKMVWNRAEEVKQRMDRNISVEDGTWRDYLTLTKPGIVRSNLLTAFGGFWLATQSYTVEDFGLRLFFMLLGASLVMAGACVLNNYIDRDIDPYMSRTVKRPTVGGRIPLPHVFRFGIVLSVAGLVSLAFFVNIASAMMGLIGLFSYVILYTVWSKRTMTLNTVVGSISGAMPPVIGYVAVSGIMDYVAWILFLFLFLWQPPHFLALAMRRTEEYRAAGIPMLPVVKGFEATKRQMVLWTAVLVPASLYLFPLGVVGIIYFVVALVLGLVWAGSMVFGFYAKNEIKWANWMFFYSIAYLTVLFLLMIIDSTV